MFGYQEFGVGASRYSACSTILHRAERVEEIHIHVGDDIGRERERQRERPGERVAAGEPVGGDEPCRAGADDRGERRDAGEQQHGLTRSASGIT